MTDEPFEMIRGAKFPTYSRGSAVRYGGWQGHSVCTQQRILDSHSVSRYDIDSVVENN